jgi:hypothetical protein
MSEDEKFSVGLVVAAAIAALCLLFAIRVVTS